MANIIKRAIRIFNGKEWDKYHPETSADQVVYTKPDGTASNVQTELDAQNSAMKVGVLTEVSDPNRDIGLVTQYRTGPLSTEVFIVGNLKASFTAWTTIPLGWIPMPNRPAKQIIQYGLETYFIEIGTDGMVKIGSTETREVNNVYINEHIMFFNATR